MRTVDVHFPLMSSEQPDTEGIVATWFVRDGQAVAEGQLIAEVQVEKVAQDVTAPVAGVVHVLVAEEQPVQQGDPIATIEA